MANAKSPFPEEVFDNIRNQFLEKYKENIDREVYHPKDLERIHQDNQWLRAIYKHSLETADKCVDNIHEILKWRKEFEANDLLNPNKLPFPRELFNLGAMFPKNRDNAGRKLIHFIVKTHKKDRYPAMDIRKFIAYHLEKEYRFNLNETIVVLFDMTDSGYANTDLDMTKFVLECLRLYYSGLIEYVIVYDMPFLFNAIWKIIKNLLPARAINLVKFVDKNSIREFVNEDQLFKHMNGQDTYTYSPDQYVSMLQLQ